MADMNYISDRDSNLTTQELEIIGYFAQGQKHSISSSHLKLEFTETSIRLSTTNGKLIGISKQTNEWQRKVLVTNDSIYRQQIVETLRARGYVARQKSSHPDFTEYHYYRVPKGYQLHYTETIQLWRAWWHNKRDRLNAPNSSIDMPIFTKGNWYPVVDLQPKQGNFAIQTAIGIISFAPEDYVVWLDRSGTSSVPPAARTTSNPQLSTIAPTEISRVLAASDRPESSGSVADLDLESYLNTFDTENTGDIDRIEGIYNIGELLSSVNPGEDFTPPVTPSVPLETAEAVESPQSPSIDATAALATSSTLSQPQTSLKLKAIDVLARYLQEGEIVTLTEVVKNADDREIERKVTTIHKGCPKWAIDLIQKLD
jgi:hypothetical protein